MSVHEDLLNNGENNCSFTEDEVDIMCSKDGDDTCRDCGRTTQKGYVEILEFTHFVVFSASTGLLKITRHFAIVGRRIAVASG